MSISTATELLTDLRRLSDEFGRLPSGQLVRDHGEHDLDEYRAAFGSLPAALEAAGFDLPEFEAQRVKRPEQLASIHRDHTTTLCFTDCNESSPD